MKRITYISNFSRSLIKSEIESIGHVSQKHNSQEDITGVLMSCGSMFFQILEGEDGRVDRLYAKILKDERHHQIRCLKSEENIEQRWFPDWPMEIIILDEKNDLLLQPIKILLQTLGESKIILANYTHSGVLQAMENGINPLTLIPRYTEKIIFFADIMSFASITEKLQVTEVVELLNQFFTVCTNAIAARGGEVTKFIGDCVMAYFDGDHADEALQASLDVLSELENLRNQSPVNSPLRVLYVGIGLSKGTVLEGNIGSQTKKEYTIIGDAVNVAARIESLTRQLNRFLVFSAAVREGLSDSWKPLRLGDFYAKGREAIVEVYSIDAPLTSQKSDFYALNQEIREQLDLIGSETSEPSKQRKTLFMLYDR
ncbi:MULTISPECIES: BLUF domain-containing protein [Pseudanabaena]|uniref:Adenylate/guanylate cyclase n=2 Tax=Pseudanabaena TaxID=1152 RepID=L8MTI5_9CYAN|nr:MULTISPECIES: BLUF domain-containing protein [Pseudanabaena]ELS30751.1 adenylate/guanylate cyclase [Pseudanabaena biceps PCC 7429]MDG3496979.1 BLUF domain-containing protein [Pseudanabaena catenata USMAC16]